MENCFICRKHKDQEAAPPGGYIYEDEHWMVCHAPGKLGPLVVCWLRNARNSLPGLAEHGSVGHLPKMGDEPCEVASQRNFS